MGMEGSNQPVNLEEIKNKILDKYISEGDSEELNNMIDSWREAKNKEADKEGTMKGRLEFEVELLDLYLNLGKDKEEVLNALYYLRDSAVQEGLDEQAEIIQNKIDSIK